MRNPILDLIEKGSTYWVEFSPTLGHEQDGERPSVVVSATEMSAGGVIQVVPTTTRKLDRIRPYEVFLPAGRGGVPNDSKAMVNQIRTIDVAERLRRPISRVDDDIMREIELAILIVFGIAA